MKVKRTRHHEYMPRWGYWTIGGFLSILILFFMAALVSRKSPVNVLIRSTNVQPNQSPIQQPSDMLDLKIIEHTSKLPYKQSFRIVLPSVISENDLNILTRNLVAEHRVGTELMFFNWWLSNQSVENDDCWAYTKCEGESVTSRFNTDSLDQHHEAVEIRPLYVPDELGLWYWNRGEISQFIHVVKSGVDTVKVHNVFLDASNSWEEKRLTSRNPLRFLWSDVDDEDMVYFEWDTVKAVIKDNKGVISTLEKLR